MKAKTIRIMAPLALAMALAGCGGGDTATVVAELPPVTPPAPVASVSGTLTLSAGTPSTHNGNIDIAKAATVANVAQAAVPVAGITSPYCDIVVTEAPGTNGKKYEVKVYFLQSDAKVINASVSEAGFPPPGYTVYSTLMMSGVPDISVNLAARTVTFNNKALTGTDSMTSASTAGTVSGTFSFPANATVAACGA